MTGPDGETTVVVSLYHNFEKGGKLKTMAGINYSAVLADLEQKKEELESAIATIKLLLAGSGGGGSGGVFADGTGSGVIDPDSVPVGSFLRLTIVDAVKKLLEMTKSKLSIPQIAKALERGGLPPAKPNTIYAVLRRRESEVGDLIRFGDEWALAEWYPNNPNLRKQRVAKAAAKSKKGKSKSATKPKAQAKKTTAAQTKPITASAVPQREAQMKTPDAAFEILSGTDGGLDLEALTSRINTMLGKGMNMGLVKSILANDPKSRFINSDDRWTVAK